MCLDGLHLGIRTSFFSTRFAPSLPTQILFADGNVIRYTYSADGRKLRAEYTTAMPATTKTIDYSGNLIFENGTLKQILVDGGYIMMDDWSNPYCLYVRDHLGNNRMVVHPSGMIEQVNNYYPYGGLMANSTGWNAQRYKYNGKELDRMHGLDWYDYGARWQDAAIGGRWHAMDPLAEKYYDVSPYSYCKSDPINKFDPDGRAIETVWDLVNLGADITSLRNNLKKGNYGAAAVDVLATIIDGAAVALPGVPGGAGATVKVARSATKAKGIATKNNYRKALQQSTGKKGKGYEAHHTLPQKYRKQFEKLGINIDEPGNVVWREAKNHRKNNSAINKEWTTFMNNKRSKKEIYRHRDRIEKKYFKNKSDNPPT